MTAFQERRELVFVVRIWHERGSRGTGWRASAVNIFTHARRYFTSYEELVAFLETEFESGV